jgi:hypothetical protein
MSTCWTAWPTETMKQTPETNAFKYPSECPNRRIQTQQKLK